MDPDVLSFAQVAAIIVMMVGSLAGIAVVAVPALVRGTKRQMSPPPQDDRLEHLQQSVDAIAVEVERIAEAQRFTARLLAERTEASGVER
jgi:hypothetical protein